MTPRERAAIVQNVVSGALSVRDVCERHELSTQCVVDWVTEFRRTSLEAFDARLRQTLESQGIAAPVDAAAPHFAVALGDLALPDLIQIMALGRRNGVISVLHDGAESHLWFAEGELVDAESGKLQAIAAVYRVLALERGRVTTSFTAEVNRPARVSRSTVQLLLEGARRADQCKAAKRVLGAGWYRLAPGVPAYDDGLPEAQRAVSSAFAAPSTVSDVLAESTLGDLETLSLIKSWVSSEYLVPEAGFQPSRALPPAEGSASDAPRALSLASVALESRTERSLRSRTLLWWPVVGLVLGAVTLSSLPKPAGSVRSERAAAAALPALPPAVLASPSSADDRAPTVPSAAVEAALGAELPLPSLVAAEPLDAAGPLVPARPLDSGPAGAAATVAPSRPPQRPAARAPRRLAGPNRAPPAVSALAAPAASVPPAPREVPRLRIIEERVPKLRVVE